MQGQRTQREVFEVVGFDHGPHLAELDSSEAPGLTARTRRSIVQHAQRLPALPHAKSTFAESNNLECGTPRSMHQQTDHQRDSPETQEHPVDEL